MRLIDADALKAYIDAQKGRPWIGCTIGEALKTMTDEQPTIEPERTGKWIRNDNGTWLCDQCNSWIPDEQHHYARFCLYCMANMEGR